MTESGAIILTGATSGIGLATARLFAYLPVPLLLHGPETPHNAAALLSDTYAIRESAPGNTQPIHYLSADFSREANVPSLAEKILALADNVGLIVNNAAIPGPPRRQSGPWNSERTFGINYLAGTLLTELLLQRVRENGRIINVASATHETASLDIDDLAFNERPYSPIAAYAQSKLAIVTHSARLATRIPQTVLSIHPGVISTHLLHAMFGVGGDTPEAGARNLFSASTTTPVPSGSYIDRGHVAHPNPVSLDLGVQRSLHDVTERLLGATLH